MAVLLKQLSEYLRQGVIKQRQLLAKQYKEWHERNRLVCMLHEIHLVVDGCTAGILACFL